MKICIYAIGKAKTKHYEDAISEYQKRLQPYVKISWHITPASNTETESSKLLKSISEEAFVVLLDERGHEWSTPELSDVLEKWQNSGRGEVVFIIGGSHGVNGIIRDRANQVWSLSKLVFPHEMVRLLLLEQLYRAYNILAGGKYHHQ